MSDGMIELGCGHAVPYLDDGSHVGHRLLPFTEVDVEMLHLIPLAVDDDITGSLSDRVDAAEVGGSIESRVWWWGKLRFLTGDGCEGDRTLGRLGGGG